ncbi:hypothetical protein O6H91_04G084700 [Diphasiastrum complanatum]|uniref:Uncharacterized protein n=3 Tax=Diphasiastrum complanatum TaxID=34168 RepID=A0ACC2DYV8_DIPCM|nr:hypothetical protein O6H91_Y084600 [Diphasiastrum complanatum]KAJ7559425.1 hypothetical protein O6H91_04G084700 [Diphasiastrum complanatum]KAJ7559426.1 hypothetical protein O6H91_04G084700 [Diphasiastrum complanatum]KAJ7559427.1 hypothetical protein O6H91_04G084700 [Diphasiastrum complanatum]
MKLLTFQTTALVLLLIVFPNKTWGCEQFANGDNYEERHIRMPTWDHGITFQSEEPSNSQDFDVMSFGATGDGVTDDTQAFTDAWAAACKVDHAHLIVPRNRSFLVGPTTFSGPCSRLSMRVEGTIVAPPSPNYWRGFSTDTWLVFSLLDSFTLEGDGIIDGQGQEWWAQSCKVNKSNPCHAAPTAVTISTSNNTRVRDLTFTNSQQMHLIFDECIKVHASDLLVTAPEKSPNTDGIHVHASSDVLITDCIIGTGDDCISIQTDTFDTRIKNVICGPGHGISIGSLGKGGSFSNVSHLIVDGAILNGTTNGLRIKSWQGGQGAANDIQFQNVRMINVSNPIIIDQYYCDSRVPCQNQTSAVEVSEITYKNIIGTSSTATAIKFACSDTVACHDILLQNVNLVMHKTLHPATSFCENAKGSTRGFINPISCLAEI